MSRRLNRLPQLVANRLARIQANVDCAVLSTACAADALFAPVPTTGAGAAKPSPLVLEYPGSLCPACVLPSETGSGYVIRLHETAGRRGTASCRTCRLGDPGGLPRAADRRIAAGRPDGLRHRLRAVPGRQHPGEGPVMLTRESIRRHHRGVERARRPRSSAERRGA